MDFEIEPTENKRILLMRFIDGWARNVADSDIYITPDIMNSKYGIDLQTIQSVLAELEEHEHIEILQKPNHKLTHEQRARQEDEKDYYLISATDSFPSYYRAIEQGTSFHRADVVSPKPQIKKDAKLRYDNKEHTFRYGNSALSIKGALRQEICKRVFRNRKTEVLYNDILDAVDMNKQSRAVYDAVLAINKKLEDTFGLQDVIEPIPNKEKVRVSKNCPC